MFDVNDNLSYNTNTYNRMTMIDNCLRVTMINYIWNILNNTKIYLTKLISRIKRNKNEQTSKSYKFL